MSTISATAGQGANRRRFWVAFSGLVLALAVLCVLNLAIGSKFVAPTTVIEAFFQPDAKNFDHRIVNTLRLVRLEAALLVGAALGIAGALLQSIIRNPIAEPGILGLNAGAALLVVVASTVTGGTVFDGWARPWIASIGACILFGLVLGLASAGRNGPTPLKVTLAGVAMTSFAGALTNAILILNENSLQNLRNWFAGHLAGKQPGELVTQPGHSAWKAWR